MLKEEKTICSRFHWLSLSHRKRHPFPEPIAFRLVSFVKRSQVSWLLVLGFLALERGCIQRSSALGLFGFHRAIKRVTETLRCCSRLLWENERVPAVFTSRDFELVSGFQPYNTHFAKYTTHIWHQKMLYVYTTLSNVFINGIFDKDDAKNFVTGLDGKLLVAFFGHIESGLSPFFYALLRNVQFRNDYFRA